MSIEEKFHVAEEELLGGSLKRMK